MCLAIFVSLIYLAFPLSVRASYSLLEIVIVLVSFLVIKVFNVLSIRRFNIVFKLSFPSIRSIVSGN